MFNDFNNEQNDVPWNTEQNWDSLDDWQKEYLQKEYTIIYRANTSGDYDWVNESYDENDMIFDEFEIFHNGEYITTVEYQCDIQKEILEHFFDEVCCQDLYEEWGENV